MKISTKGRYGLFSIIEIASLHKNGEYVTLISLSEKLKISKIYLEQVFSILRKSGLVISAKGAQGGYRLSRNPNEITVFEVMKALETGLFDKTEKTLENDLSNLEEVVNETVYNPLDKAVRFTLEGISIQELVESMNKYGDKYMYYI